jgi:hypothetical protein
VERGELQGSHASVKLCVDGSASQERSASCARPQRRAAQSAPYCLPCEATHRLQEPQHLNTPALVDQVKRMCSFHIHIHQARRRLRRPSRASAPSTDHLRERRRATRHDRRKNSRDSFPFAAVFRSRAGGVLDPGLTPVHGEAGPGSQNEQRCDHSRCPICDISLGGGWGRPESQMAFTTGVNSVGK